MRCDEGCLHTRLIWPFFLFSHDFSFQKVAMTAGGTAAPSGPAAMNIAIESALSNLKPLRDLAQNWDIDIASW